VCYIDVYNMTHIVYCQNLKCVMRNVYTSRIYEIKRQIVKLCYISIFYREILNANLAFFLIKYTVVFKIYTFEKHHIFTHTYNENSFKNLIDARARACVCVCVCVTYSIPFVCAISSYSCPFEFSDNVLYNMYR